MKSTVREHVSFELVSAFGRFLRLDRPALYHGQNILHMGAAGNYKSGAVNADFFHFAPWKRKGPKLEWYLDLRYDLNCPDQVFDGVFTEHTLEHLYPDEVESLLCEIYRVMKVDATIRITVPDLALYVAFYSKQAGRDQYQGFSERFPRGAVALRALSQDFAHKSLWDYDEMRHVLHRVGFRNIAKSSFGESSLAELAFDLEDRRWETLYVEAVK